jgi:hypothetical protein
MSSSRFSNTEPRRRVGVIVGSNGEYRHLDAAQLHDLAAERHRAAAMRYELMGDDELAALELRNVEIDQRAAELERDRAALVRRRLSEGATPQGCRTA